MNIIVTGGLGFIGFNFIQYLINKKVNAKIVCVDANTYAAKPHLDYKLEYCKAHDVKIYYENICSSSAIEEIIKKEKIDGIINFAAQTHVDNSINGPSIFIDSNIVGTQVLLELARKYDLRFHQISTDEVYGSVDPKRDIVKEDFKYNPSSPYSSSKASADLIALSYFKTFGTKVTISRCTNNYGRYQHEEKLIPKVIYNIKHNIKIPVYGDGMQMRNWIHVLDHCDAIWRIYNCSRYGQIYNVGSTTLIPNINLIKLILNHLNASEGLIEFVKDRPAHDFAYHLNSEKIEKELGWKQQISFEKGIDDLLNFEK